MDSWGAFCFHGLRPDTEYRGLLHKGELGRIPDNRGDFSFRTAPAPGQLGRSRVALVSCFGSKGADANPAWTDMNKHARADLVLSLGDSHYANTTDPAKQRKAYVSHRSQPGFGAVASTTPIYSIWDDHDYGPNDTDGTLEGKERSLKTWQEHWANPSYGEESNPGVYYKFTRAGVEYFMLDVRYHRDPDDAPNVEGKTMLGAVQKKWLLDGLKTSRAKVKVIGTGSEMQLFGHRDSWTSYEFERREILDFIRDEKIEGVLFVSGDRHFTAGYHIRGEVVEITSGPLGSGNARTPVKESTFFKYTEGKLYVVLDIDTTPTPPEVAYEVFRAGDGRIERRNLSWDQINGKETFAFLEPGTKSPNASADAVPVKKADAKADADAAGGRDGGVLIKEDFESGSKRWKATEDAAWKIEKVDGSSVFWLHRQSNYQPPVRSPVNIALLEGSNVGDFELTAKVKTTTRDYGHRSMCLFFGYQDSSHFYYVHLGQKADDHANQIFIVNDKPRTKISITTTEGTPWDDQWHQVKIVRKIGDGTIEVYWDDMKKPVMTAKNSTFTWGQVGLGSFDDTGMWDDVVLKGIAGKKPEPEKEEGKVAARGVATFSSSILPNSAPGTSPVRARLGGTNRFTRQAPEL